MVALVSKFTPQFSAEMQGFLASEYYNLAPTWNKKD
ncbi:hypothetical protein NIES4101_41680 [Calothrix sp. NIES-4101]|nr:hypothetical protein NIES4101_41680 [Calothrix sp. NIES-4101]